MSTQTVTLDGGTKVFVESSHAVGLISIVVALRTGARHDPEDKAGLGRIAARMLRRGAEGRTAQQIEAAIDSMGAELAVDAGSTGISLHAQVIARNVEPFVALLHSLLATPTFPEDELERLLRESAAEIVEARDNDRIVAHKAMQRTLFKGHPYGRNAGGTTESLARITKSDVVAWYREHIVKPNIVISYAGDVTLPSAQTFSEAIVRDLGTTSPPALAAMPPVPPKGRRLVFVDKPTRTQTQIIIGRLGTSPHDHDHHAVMVGNAVFGGTFTSRLVKAIRTERGWSYSPGSRMSVDRERHAFYMITAPSVSDAPPCLTLEIQMLEELVSKGVTEDEVEFVKKYLIRSYAFDIDSAAKRVHQALDVELLGLPLDYYSGYTKNTASVTFEEVSRAVGKRLSADDLVIVVVGTASELYAPMSAAIPQLTEGTIVPYDAE